MVLSSWLTIQNQAISRIEGETITAGDLIANLKSEAKKVNLFWDEALETVLTDHDWGVATKTLLLGSSTTEETPTTPVGATEAATSNTVRKYYMPVPDYDATGATPGTVNFEIVRVIRNSYAADWVPQKNRVYFYQPIAGVNVYVDVIFKLGYADAGRDILFCRALKTKLAQLIARFAGKDNPRDAILQAEYDKYLAEARFRDNSTGDSAVNGNRTWFEAATGVTGMTGHWSDAAGRIHSED